MNANFSAIVTDLWSLAGWTMIHFLWLGTIVAAIAFAGRMLLQNASPAIRYAFALMCLVAIATMPLAAACLSRTNILASPLSSNQPLPVSASQPPSIPNPALFAPTIIELHTPTTGPAASPSSITPLPTLQPSPLDPRFTTNTAPPPSASPSSPLLILNVRLASLIRYLPWLWLIGTPLTFALVFTGLIGTHRLSRASTPITTGPIADALARLSTSLRITRLVTVAVCERVAAPVLIGIVRPMILLPPAALTGWSPDEIEMVLLHELAHIRRYDNVVNLAQRIIESLLFFHPAVWLISTWVRREREASCDAAVVSRTQQPHAYAELLLNIATHLSEPGRPRPRHFAPLHTAMAAGPLRTRIRHILQLEDDPMLITPKSLVITLATLLAAATLAFVYLPKIGQAEQSATENAEKKEPSQEKNQARTDASQISASSALPHVVKFEQGTSRFLDGDGIEVREVRGTAPTFEPGQKYVIRGTYKLQSHERAQLSANVTAKEAANGTGPRDQSQTQVVNRGAGDFVLVLPMTYRGWPHVSFYPADGGEGFGGTYIGTGDSVLKKWPEGPSDVSDIERFRRMEMEIKTIDIVVVLFNNHDASLASGLQKAYEGLTKRNRSLYVYGAELDPAWPEAKRYNLKDSPTCIVFVHGKEAGRLDTIRNGDQLQEFVRTTINQAGLSAKEKTKNIENEDSQNMEVAQAATQKNLKQLIMAVHNNVGSRGSFPANAIYDPERRPLLSWRVYILPFLAEEKLYSEFHLGEPWNSEHNRKLIARMPAVFKNPRIDKPGFTNYLAVVGKECVFDGSPKGLRFQNITDGTSNTIAIVEANADLAVEWTKPQDWNFGRAAPTKGLGQLWGDGWYAAWVDGSVRRTENKEPADKIGIQFTRAGGETESLKQSANNVLNSEGENLSGPGMMDGSPSTEASPVPLNENDLTIVTYNVPREMFPALNQWAQFKRVQGDSDSKKSQFILQAPEKIHASFRQLLEATPKWLKDHPVPHDNFIETSGDGADQQVRWREMGMTLGQPKEIKENTTPFRRPSPAKGVAVTNVEVGSPADWLTIAPGDVMRDISQFQTPTAAEAAKIIKAISEGDRNNHHTITVIRASGEVLHTYLPIQRFAFNADKPIDLTTAEAGTKGTASKFPSLEDQKLADLAWKRLGLELEPITADDLQRVKALGYDGGVKVVVGQLEDMVEGTRGRASGNYGRILAGDLLVGLHVWPTTNLKDIATILYRDDLVELNPIKYYVVRASLIADEKGVTHRDKDVVESGRITVQLLKSSNTDNSSSSSKSSTPAGPQPTVNSSATTTPLPRSSPYSEPTWSTKLNAAQPTGSQAVGDSAADRARLEEAQHVANAALIKARDEAESLSQLLKEAKSKVEQAKAKGENIEAAQRAFDSAQRKYEAARESWTAAGQRHIEIIKAINTLPPTQPAPHPLPLPPNPSDSGSSTAPSPLPSATSTPAINPLAPATAAEIEVLRERVKMIEDRYRAIEALYKTASRGGSMDAYEVSAYELDLARGELALAEGKRDAAQKNLADARQHAEAAFQAVSVAYQSGRITYDRVLEAARNLSDIKLRLIRLNALPSSPAKPNASPPTGNAPSTPNQGVPNRYDAGPSTATPMPSTENSPVLHSVVISPTSPPSISPAPRSSPLAPQASLRYDGKPFEEWRNVWKTELSTEKRIEAVKALAAFGRAGYGQEAAAAILDVAGEYDFSILQGGNPEGDLRQAVLEALVPIDRSQKLAPYWVPDVAVRLQKDPKKWRWLAYHLLTLLQSDDESTLKIVRDLESSSDIPVRSAALGALVRASLPGTGASPLDEKTRKLIDKYLDSNDPEMVRAALSYLIYNRPSTDGTGFKPQLLYQPVALSKLLFHADREVRRQARRLLPLLDDKATSDLVDQLIAILKDPSRQRDHIEAIRAISALGKKAAKATVVLAVILKSSDDQPTLAATMVALARIAGRSAEEVVRQNVQPPVVKHCLGIDLSDDEARSLDAKIGGAGDIIRSEFLERLSQEQQVPSLQNADRGGGVF